MDAIADRNHTGADWTRRRACLLLAGLAVPMALHPAEAIAQDAPAVPPVVPPPPPPQLSPPTPTPTPTPPPPPRPPLLAGQVDKSKIYYLFFDGSLDANSTRNLRRQLSSLVEAGVTQINLVLSSPGGLLEPTLVTYGFIRSLPAAINTHAQGFVQSAATVLFLAGQERSSDRSAQFLFHPSQSLVTGSLGEQQIQERLSQFAAADEAVAQIYKERTALSDGDIAGFNHGQVIFNAKQALDHGVVQVVEDLKIPGPQTARIVILE